MADDIDFVAGGNATPAALTKVAAEEVTTLNGSTVPAKKFQRLFVALRSAAGVALDITNLVPLPVAVRRMLGTNYADGSVSVATTSATPTSWGVDANRLSLEVFNNSDTTWWVAWGGQAAVVGEGKAIPPGASREIDETTDAVQIIHGGTGTKSGSWAKITL